MTRLSCEIRKIIMHLVFSHAGLSKPDHTAFCSLSSLPKLNERVKKNLPVALALSFCR
jgi:hypothetical protein